MSSSTPPPPPPKNFSQWRECNGCACVSDADLRAAAPALRTLLAGTYQESGADTVERIGIWADLAGVDTKAIDNAWLRLSGR